MRARGTRTIIEFLWLPIEDHSIPSTHFQELLPRTPDCKVHIEPLIEPSELINFSCVGGVEISLGHGGEVRDLAL